MAKKTVDVKYIKNVLIDGVSSYVEMTEEEIAELKKTAEEMVGE